MLVFWILTSGVITGTAGAVVWAWCTRNKRGARWEYSRRGRRFR